LIYNYLLTDPSGQQIRVNATVYEAGLYASVDVTDDVTALSAANQIEIIVYRSFLDVTDAVLIGRALAMTYSASNEGIKPDHIASLVLID